MRIGTLRSRAWLSVGLCAAVALASCASAGRVTLGDTAFRFNRSAVEREGERYRLWVWRHHGGLLDYFGRSPIGLQMLLPARTAAGDTLVVGRDCLLWMRTDWSLVSELSSTLWQPITSGSVHIDTWQPNEMLVRGRLEVSTDFGPMRGTFIVSIPSLSEDLIR